MSSVTFFIRGRTSARLYEAGIFPQTKELFTRSVMNGARLSKHCLRRFVGIGSILHDVDFDDPTILTMSSTDIGLKALMLQLTGSGLSGEQLLSTIGRLFRKVIILSMK